MFRDESESVARKALSSRSSTASSKSSSSRRQKLPQSTCVALPKQNVASYGTSDSSNSLDDPIFDFVSDLEPQYYMLQHRQGPLGTHPNTGISRQEAICFFLQSHTMPGNFLITDTLTNFLMESGGSLGQQAIQSSIVAVASAMLSRVRNIASLRQAARQEYGSALKLVNKALADVEEAKTNQTLGAVVLLALYEVSTSLDLLKKSNSNIGRSSYQELRRVSKAGQIIFVELQLS